MFKYTSKRKQQELSAKELADVNYKLAKTEANLDYVAMMSDIELDAEVNAESNTQSSTSYFSKVFGGQK